MEMRHYLNSETKGGELSQSQSVKVVTPLNSNLLNLQSLQILDLNQDYDQELENLSVLDALTSPI